MTAYIYIVEDHEFMRRALVDLIECTSGFEVAGAVETAEEALDQLDSAAVDLVLVDTSLPNMNGIELVGELTKRWPKLRCVMLTGHDQHTYVEQAMEAGARGYVLKSNPDELPEAIRRVLSGGVYFSASLYGERL